MPLDSLTGQFIVLTTFRQDGTPVPTTVWFAIHEGEVIFATEPSTGKVKRIRNNPDVTMVRSGWRGKPKSDIVVSGTARFLDGDEAEVALQRLKTKYGWQWRLAGNNIHTALAVSVDGVDEVER